MAGNADKLDSLRPNRFDSGRLMLALMISLAVHVIGFGGYELGKELNIPLFRLLALVKPAPPQPQTQKYEAPLEFVTVDQPSKETPQHAVYYSSKNSVAANPDATTDTGKPKLNGTQTDAPKTETAPRQNFNQLQPQPPDNNLQAVNSAVQSGDLTLGKPQDLQPQPRPRTIREALAQNHLQGVQMRQDGGVSRRAVVPSFDAMATPFGAYDEAIVEAIQQYWDNELDSQKFAQDRTGKVTLRFHLNYDGTVTDMQVLDNTVGELLCYVCQEAITRSAPFAPWPSDMRRMVGANYREITFTFYYY